MTDTDERKTHPPGDAFSSFGFYSVPELSEEQRKPPDFIIEEMVPCGVTFLHGPPKSRKSFMILQALIAVATGEPFLNFKTVQCDCAYLDLEGSPSRISTRAEKMTVPIPSNVFVTNSVKERLADKLVDRLRELHRQRPSIRLIAIDTFSRARGNVRTMGSNAYDVDVRLLEPIQRMALEEQIAIIFVHHDKKNAGLASDTFERLNGTMGLTGSADSVLSLSLEGKRGDGRATLEYTPRDARGGEIKLFFDETVNEWHRVAELPPPDIRGNPVCNWVIENAPDRGQAGDFFTYSDIFKAAFRYVKPDCGDVVRKTLLERRTELFTEYSIGVQLGVKYHGERGVRIINLA